MTEREQDHKRRDAVLLNIAEWISNRAQQE